MNALNRAVMVVLFLIAIVLCTVLFVGARWVLPPLAQQSSALAEYIQGRALYEVELPGCAIAGMVDLVLVLFILLELRRPRGSIRVEKAGGEVLVALTSIADRLKHDVNQLSDVVRTRPNVSARRKGVVVELDVEAEAGVNVPDKAEQIVGVARRVVEEDMGLELARPPKVKLRIAPRSKTPRAPVRPSETPPARPSETPPVRPREAPPAEPLVMSPVEPGDWSPVEPVEPIEEEDLPDFSEDLENL
jgi:hypothetical protein